MKLTAESTVFNDEKVQSKFSELIVDADGIRTEVSKKVGNNEVISRINQSAESVKIQADKVNIEGAAIFTGSGRLSTTSLNATYDANGAATGAVNTLKNDLSSASGTTVVDGGHIATNSIGANKIKVDEIEIGAAQIASGTIDVARIPDLSAEKITTGTISIARIPSTARNDTYITDIDDNGIKIHAANNVNSNYAQVDSSGMNIYRNGNSVALFGIENNTAISRIGRKTSGEMCVEIVPGGMDIIRDRSKVIAHFGYEAVNTSTETSTSQGEAPYYNLGIRKGTKIADKGQYSVIEGYDTMASGSYSHAEGLNTTASKTASHAEGMYTTASGSNSHAEGELTIAKGHSSHAGGFNTIANEPFQTVIGMYNDNNYDTLFEIGNGMGDSERSNSHEFTFDGDVRLAFRPSTDDTDKEIYDAMVSLGWI